MPSQMQIANLQFVDSDHPRAQRVAVLEAPRKLSVAYAEIPEPGLDEVRIKIKWVGVCGSDIEAYRGTREPEFLSMPARLGHEVAGVIDRIGDDVVGLNVGDTVTCRYVWGAFAQFIVCKPFNVKVLPPGFPLRETSLIEILPGVIHAAELCKIGPNTKILITGQGVSGLVMTQVLSLYSPKVLAVTDLRPRNIELAQRYGATHTYQLDHYAASTRDAIDIDFPDGFDVVVPCLLEGDGMVDAIECAAICGRIVMYGCIGTCHRPVDFFAVHRKRLNIYSTEPRRDIDMRRYFQEGVQMVIDGLVNTSQMITHTVPLSDVARAFALRDSADNDAIHVLVDCEA